MVVKQELNQFPMYLTNVVQSKSERMIVARGEPYLTRTRQITN